MAVQHLGTSPSPSKTLFQTGKLGSKFLNNFRRGNSEEELLSDFLDTSFSSWPEACLKTFTFSRLPELSIAIPRSQCLPLVVGFNGNTVNQSAPPSMGWCSGSRMFSLQLKGLNSGPGSLPGLQISRGDLMNVLNMERRGNQALLGGAGGRKHQPNPRRLEIQNNWLSHAAPSNLEFD